MQSFDQAGLETIERNLLAELEGKIERGLQTFYEVGTALAEIRELRLYREGYATFEDYCRDRWGMSKTQANRLVSATEVVNNLTPIGVIPITESQVRPLTKLEPEQQQAVWAEAVETAQHRKVTAAQVEAVVEQFDRANHAHKILNSSKSNEWYTPAKYLEAVRQVLGAIDLDPASNPQANELVKAALFYAQDDDGLSQNWAGRVWLNPPYGITARVGSNQAIWTKKLIAEYETGNVTEAILLVNAATERSWFQPLWDYPICFTDHRISFYRPEGEGESPTIGNAFVYFGDCEAAFIELFTQWGAVVKRCKINSSTLSLNSRSQISPTR